MLCLAEADLKLLLVSYVFPIILSLPEGIKFKFLGNLPNLLYVMSVISVLFFLCTTSLNALKGAKFSEAATPKPVMGLTPNFQDRVLIFIDNTVFR